MQTAATEAQELFRCFSTTLCGHKYGRAGRPCQDAAGFTSTERGAVLALSDGHGAPSHFLSEYGSRFAVEVALRVLGEFFLSEDATRGPGPDQSWVAFRKMLPDYLRLNLGRIRREWEGRCHAFWNVLVGAGARSTEDLRDDLRSGWDSVLHPFGATLLAAVMTPDWWVAFRLGDGEGLVVDETGHGSFAFERVQKLQGEATQSLCHPQWDEAVVIALPQFPARPKSLCLCSDGLADPYTDDEIFLRKWAEELARELADPTWRSVCAAINGRVAPVAEVGGDDVGLCFARRVPGVDTNVMDGQFGQGAGVVHVDSLEETRDETPRIRLSLEDEND